MGSDFIVTASLCRGNDDEKLLIEDWMFEKADLQEKKKGMFDLVKESEKNVAVYGVSRG